LGTPVVYPNPFTGGGPAQVELVLGQAASDVYISVFTTAFRKVNETHYGAQLSGVVKLPLQAKDQGGTTLANGLYYLLVGTPQERSVLKWIVAR
jgi:hypothetical protein